MSPFTLPQPSPLLAGLSSLASLVIALVVLNRNPRRAENQAFFALVALGVLTNLNGASLFLGVSPEPLSTPRFQLVIALGGLSMYALVLFAHAFPFNRRPSRLLFWGMGLLALAHFVITLERFESPLALAYSRLYFGLCILFSVLFVGRNYRQLSSPSERAGLLLVQSVILTRFVLSALAYALPRADGHPFHGLLVVHLIISPPLMAAALGYGLTRFQLMGTRFVLSRSLAYFLVSIMVLALYLGVILVMQSYLRNLLDIESTSWFTTPLLVVLLMVTFHPLRVRIEVALDRWLDRGFVKAQEAAESYFSRSQSALGLRALYRVVRDTTAVIVPGSRLALLMARPSPRLLTLDGITRFLPTGWHGEVGTVTGELVISDDDNPVEVIPVPAAEELMTWFRRSRRSYLQRTLERPFPGDTPGMISSLKVDLLIPFWRDGSVDGVLLLQAPQADGERIRLLIEVARHLGLQLENTLLYQQAIDANEALTLEKKTLDDTRLFLESMFEAVPVGMAVVDTEGRLVKWNRGMERLTGVPRALALAPEADINTMLPGLGLHGPDTEAARGLTTPLQRRLKLGGQTGAVAGESGSAGETIVHMRLSFIKDGRGALSGTVLILTDVTQQVAMQEALEAAKRLAALGQFAAAMAHEIRTPMTSIQMNVQILAGKVDLPPEDYEYFDIILTELERLNRTVGEILDFAKPMRLDAAELEMRDLVDEVVRGLYFLLAERGVEVVQELAEGLVVQADGERLKQVLINLLDNASHAIEENPARNREDETPGVVRVRAYPARGNAAGGVGAAPYPPIPPSRGAKGEPAHPGLPAHVSEGAGREGRAGSGAGGVTMGGAAAGVPGVMLEVIDQGCGMAQDKLAHIFEPFYTTRPKGTGLGLAIARKIVEAHGGQLTAESVAGEGSTFRMWLPVRARG